MQASEVADMNAVRDEISDIVQPIHWETWKAALFSDHAEGWPDDDDQEAIVRRVDSMAVGEHWEAWGGEILDKLVGRETALRAERDQLLNLVRDLAPYAASVMKEPRHQAKADTQEHISRGDRTGVTYGQLREIVRIAARATAEELA